MVKHICNACTHQLSPHEQKANATLATKKFKATLGLYETSLKTKQIFKWGLSVFFLSFKAKNKVEKTNEEKE